MPSSGPRYPTAAVNLSNAGTSEDKDAWVNPTNVGADDASEAVITAATFDSPDISQILVASNFGFAIPAGSTIDGILVEIMRRNSAGAASDNRVQLATGTTFATLVGDNKANTALDWPTAEAQASYGGAADAWNAGLTRDQVNATGFAVFLSVQADAANTDIQVDYIRVTITYTGPVQYNQTLPATTTVTPALTRVASFVQTLAATTAVAPAFVRAIAKTLAATTTVAPALARQMFVTLTAVTTAAASMTASLVLHVTMTATTAVSAALGTAFTAVRSLAAVSTAGAALATQFTAGAGVVRRWLYDALVLLRK